MINELVIAPSILTADFGNFEKEILSLKATDAKWIHIDVMDGHFVPPITFGSQIVDVAKKTAPDLLRDVHLMVTNPQAHIESFAKAGAQNITFHVEADGGTAETIAKIKKAGAGVGISLNPGTKVEAVFPYLKEVDLVLVMSVNPGYGGQKFIEDSPVKIAAIKKELAKISSRARIEVDGGVNDKTGRLCVEQGADTLVAGNFVFSNSDRGGAIKGLISSCKL